MTDSAEALPLERRGGPASLWQRLRRLHRRSDQLRGYMLLSPTLFIMVLFLAVPVAILFVLSFWTQTYIDIQPDFTAENYLRFFDFDKIIYWFLPGNLYSKLLIKSILISLCVATVTVLLAYPIAYYIAFRVKRAKMMWLILITIPFWTSYLLRVFAWKITLGYNGVINSGLIALGIVPADKPLAFLLYNDFSVIITLAHAWAAFAILPIYVSLEKIDRTLLEAATDLGDGRVSRFFGVTLPLSLPGVIAAFLFVFIPTVGDYVTPRLVGGTSGIMIGNAIQTQFGKANNWPMGAALAVISMLTIALLVCLFLLAVRTMQRRAAT